MKSAAANAENNFNMDPDKLYVSATYATPGPILKRMMPRAQGRGVSDQQAYLSHHRRGERERISEEV